MIVSEIVFHLIPFFIIIFCSFHSYFLSSDMFYYAIPNSIDAFHFILSIDAFEVQQYFLIKSEGNNDTTKAVSKQRQ